MASFESKVSEIFDENFKLSRKAPLVIRKIFNESEYRFKQRLKTANEEAVQHTMLRLFDILYIDFYFEELDDFFLNWVIDHYANRFTEPELAEMRAQTKSYLDFYEIQKVIPGKGSFIKSLISQNEGFLKDVSSSFKLAKWDIVFTRCYLYNGNYYATGSLSLFSQADKTFILDQIEKARLKDEYFSQTSQYDSFAKHHWELFYKIEREIKEKEKNKKYYTKYGELQFCEVRFEVKDIQSVLKKIDLCDEFNFIKTKECRNREKKGSITRYLFDWITLGIEEELKDLELNQPDNGMLFFTSQLDIKGNPMGIDVIGTLHIDQFLCRLEIQSFELAEYAVSHFNRNFGNALRFKRIIKTKNNNKPKEKSEEEPKEPKPLNKVRANLINNFNEKYYLSLLNEKLPALKNMTPREARQDHAIFPLLINWLKGLENSFERNKLEGEKSNPINRIKKELNIDW